MAVTTVTSGLNQVKGIKYTVITDSSSDWASVGNNVYFYDKATSLPYYKNAGGTVVSIFEEGGVSSNVYTADGTLAGDRTVGLSTHTLTLDGTGNNNTQFQVNCKEVYTGLVPYFKVDLEGGISVLGSNGTQGAISAYSSHVGTGNPRIFNVSRFGGGSWYSPFGSVTIGVGAATSRISVLETNVDFYDVNNNLRHKIGLSTGSNNQHTRFFVGGFVNNSSFIIGSLAAISTEKISLQGDTLISEKLELSTTTDGFLMPRLTTAQKNAIPSPVDTNLMVFDTDLNSLQRYNGSAWVAMAAGYGILGIANTSGFYTYYTTYTLAMAAASAGDTVEQFGNITETGNVTITIPVEVSINMNGYTYTLDGSDNSLFLKNGVGTKTKFINGTIIKKNSPTPNGGGNGLTVGQSAELDCTGLTVISDGADTLNISASGVKVIGGEFIYNGTDTGFTGFISGKLIGSSINTGLGSFRITGDGLYSCTVIGAVATASGGILKNTNIYNTGTIVALTLTGARAYNCNVYSQSSNAIFLNNIISECHNSIGKSDAGVGIYTDRGKTYNSTGISTSTVGMFVNQADAQISFCIGESSASSGIELRVGNIFNSVGKSTYNNALGHGIYVGNNNGTVSNCTGITVNASAHAIQAGTVNRNIKISNLKGKGMTTLIGNKAINIQTNTPDNFGNLLIG
tara:strand:+ start:12580 stop:14628 length:2049 start_codon:yes stop_codon:yes gene_type:complete